MGDHTIHLDYDGTNALYLPTATAEVFSAIRSKYDEAIDADPTLPPVWSPDTLGARVSIAIAGDVTPTVVSVSCPLTPGGGGISYGVGEVIDLEVLFSTRIFVKNSLSLPYLLVETGEERRGEARVRREKEGEGGVRHEQPTKSVNSQLCDVVAIVVETRGGSVAEGIGTMFNSH